MIDNCRKEMEGSVKYILIGDKSNISQTRKRTVTTDEARRVSFNSNVNLANNNWLLKFADECRITEFFELDENCLNWNGYSEGRNFLDKLIYVSIKKLFTEEPNYTFELLPIIVDKFINQIENREYGIKTPYLYKRPGNEDEINELLMKLKLYSSADIENYGLRVLNDSFKRYIGQSILITDDVYNLLSKSTNHNSLNKF